MTTEIRCFFTEALHRESNESVKVEIPSGALVVRFKLLKRTGSRRFDTHGGITYDDPATVVYHEAIALWPSNFLANRAVYTKILSDFFSYDLPDVPDYEYPDIIEKTFKAVEAAVLGLPIDMVSVDTTVRLLGYARCPEEYHMNLDRVTRELLEFSKRVVGTKLTIDGLENVTLDSLNLTAKQTTCVICREDLDRIDVVEERVDRMLVITRLPCSHMYHGDCIADWLQISHSCPFCLYPLLITRVDIELSILEVKDQGPVVEVKDKQSIVEVIDQQSILEVAGEGPIVEVTDDQPIGEVAGEQPMLEVAAEPPKTSRGVDWPMMLKMSACGVVTAMLLHRLLKWN